MSDKKVAPDLPVLDPIEEGIVVPDTEDKKDEDKEEVKE